MPRSGTRGALLRTPRSARDGHFSGILGLGPGAHAMGTSPNAPERTRWALLRDFGTEPRSARDGHFSERPGAHAMGTSQGFWHRWARSGRVFRSPDRWARSGRLFRSPPCTTEGTRSPPACRSLAQIPYPRGPRPCLGKDLYIRVSVPLEVVARKPGTLGVRSLTARGLSRIHGQSCASRVLLGASPGGWVSQDRAGGSSRGSARADISIF